MRWLRMWSRPAMNTAFVAASGKLPESGTHSLACFTHGGCGGFGGGEKRRRRRRRKKRAAWGRLSCGRAAVPPLARKRGKRGDGGGWWWKRCLRQLRKVLLIYKMEPAGPPPAHIPAGRKSAWEGNEVTGSVQFTFAEDLPQRETRREEANNGVDFGVPRVSDCHTHVPG